MITLLIKGNLIYPPGQEDVVPLTYVITHIGKLLEKPPTSISDRVVCLQAKTASGKSTSIPPVLYTDLNLGLYKYMDRSVGVQRADKRQIVCTQPRIITTISTPIGIVADGYYHSFVMGKDIGYKTGPSSEQTFRGTGLMFMVLQSLMIRMKMLSDDAIMETFKIIIIDEAHERSVALDTTMSIIKQFLARNHTNPKCPIFIFMSATFDPDRYSTYFGANPAQSKIVVEGFSHPVETIWAERPIANYVVGCADVLRQIIEKERTAYSMKTSKKRAELTLADYSIMFAGDILIFVPGERPAREIAKAIADTCARENFTVLSISGLAVKANSRDFGMLMAGRQQNRRVIITTNVAETGLTIKGLKYVIDCGWDSIMEYNPWYNVRGLIAKPAAQSNILQRRGRVGRDGPGTFYPLYTEEIFNSLVHTQYPNIIREDPTDVVLEFLESGPKDTPRPPEQLDMLDNPGAVALHRTYFKLCALGLAVVDTSTTLPGHKITDLGRIAYKLCNKITVEDVKMILAGYAWGMCIMDLITIAAFNAFSRIDIINDFIPFSEMSDIINLAFNLPPARQPNSYFFFKLLFCDDFLENLVIYCAFNRKFAQSGYDIVSTREWCLEHHLIFEGLCDIAKLHDEIVDDLISCGLNVYFAYDQSLESVLATLEEYRNNDRILKYKQCIYEGFKINVAVWDGQTYVSREGLRFDYNFMAPYAPNWSIFKEKAPLIPQRILYNRLDMIMTPDKTRFIFKVDRVSVMDGYLHDDIYFGADSLSGAL
jgi:HrpA-like RNA helicase